ncbi:restriction endonuclease subunit S [Treponema rectale]|uniref:Restriction endonuclease subunit S n=1 Tax=Treponema rectale TaxID=744512 RepID=A0A840SDQ6_9SPIR|nr:restriction endonuclease subunit S [Treponema rectale]MBB5218994.1 type I restriction enzyme S subunit [Treponema rectale]QOS41094.1 restriction endonuclease subunit S [Treponema rectale]
MSEWKTVRLGDVCEIVTGGTPSTAKEDYWKNGNIPWLQSGACQNCFVNSTDTFITKEGLNNSSAKLMPSDTVLIALTGATTGKVGYLTFEACANQSVTGILPNNIFSQLYLYYFLISQRAKILSDSYGGAQKHISQGYVKNIVAPLPPLDEQKHIAFVLDKCNKLIAKYKHMLGKYDTLIKSRFIEMFGDPLSNPKEWKKKELQELVTDDCTISYGIVQTGENQKEGIKVFRPIDIVNRKPVLSGLIKTTEEISNKYKKTLLKGHELLITVRANIGDTCVIGSEFKGCNVGRGIVPIRTNESLITLEFLKNQFDTVEMNRYVKSLAKGITLIQLNMEDLRKINLIVPPLELQNQFNSFVQQIDKSKFAVQKSLKKAETLYKSLMQEYFG